MLDREEGQLLLRIAREALGAHFGGGRMTVSLRTGVATHHAGAFVTLRSKGELRGCVGHIEPEELRALVARCAVAAAVADPRFPPLRHDELTSITVEVSVLGLLERVTELDSIEVGRHGLVVETAGARGLLLPQVATEWGWDRQRFLTEACRKAGIGRDALNGTALLWKFEAEIFAEA